MIRAMIRGDWRIIVVRIMVVEDMWECVSRGKIQ